jgi:hypothetical protein
MDLHDVSPLLEDVSHPTGNWPTKKWFCLENDDVVLDAKKIGCLAPQ